MPSTRITIFVVSLICRVFQLSHGSSVKYELTYYDDLASWNTATKVCKTHGGYLVKVDNAEISSVIQHFKNNDWGDIPNLIENDYWIGLSDKNTPDGDYVWQDCTRPNHYKNWAPGEPDQTSTDYCIRGTERMGLWRTKECGSDYQFVCQRDVGPCTFSTLPGRKILESGQYTSTRLMETYNTLDSCQSKCTGGDTSDNTCWAVTYVASALSCTLHTGSDPGALMSFQNTEIDLGAVISARICYEALSNTDSIPSTLHEWSSQPAPCVIPTQDTATAGQVSRAQTTEDLTTTSSTEQMTTPIVSFAETIFASSDVLDGHEVTTTTQDTPLKDSSLIYPGTSEEMPCLKPPCTLPEAVTAYSEIIKTQPQTTEQVPSSSPSLCPCPCTTVLSKEESAVLMSSILEDLVIEKENVSSYRRKYVSVPDDRPSAQGIGYFGGIILGVVLIGVVLLDLQKLLSDFKELFKLLRGK